MFLGVVHYSGLGSHATASVTEGLPERPMCNLRVCGLVCILLFGKKKGIGRMQLSAPLARPHSPTHLWGLPPRLPNVSERGTDGRGVLGHSHASQVSGGRE